MLAKEDIKKGETLFQIPRKLLVEPNQGSLSGELKEYEIWLQSIGRRFVFNPLSARFFTAFGLEVIRGQSVTHTRYPPRGPGL